MGKFYSIIFLVLGHLQLLGQASIDFNIKEISPFPTDVHGFAINPVDSTLYFTTFYSGDLCKLEYPYSNPYKTTGITGQRPAGLLWANQSLFLADLMEDNVLEYDQQLNLLNTYKIPSPWNMTTDGQAIYVVTFNGELYKIFNNQVLLLTSNLSYPFDIAWSPNQTLYISEQNGSNNLGRITEYDTNGNLLHIVPNTFSTPLGLSFNNQGQLFIADNATNCIFCLLPDGNMSLVSCSYNKPIAVITNLENNLFVSSAASNGTLLEISSSTPTNLEELGITDLMIFPNPTVDQLFVSMEVEHRADPQIEIYSFAGNQISVKDVTHRQVKGNLKITINTDHIEPGNYIIRVSDPKFKLTRQFTISK